MIEANRLSYTYGKTQALQDICLRFEPGKLYAIVGPNGSGKTTLLHLLAALKQPMAGELFLDGQPYGSFRKKEFAKKLALLPQGRDTPDISVYDLVCCGRFPYLKAGRMLKEKDNAAVLAALNAMDLNELAQKNVRKLSGGERQRAYMAMAYAQDTPYVLLDEPTTYLDVSYGFQIMGLMAKMKEAGKCVIAVLHDLSAAVSYADEILLLDKGNLIAAAPPTEILKSGKLDSVFGVRCSFVEIQETQTLMIREK